MLNNKIISKFDDLHVYFVFFFHTNICSLRTILIKILLQSIPDPDAFNPIQTKTAYRDVSLFCDINFSRV